VVVALAPTAPLVAGARVSGRPIIRRTVREPLSLAVAHPVLRRIYAARGVVSESELDLSLQHLLPVSSLEGVEAAAALLEAEMAHAGKILIIGDYDADGATASALLVRALRQFGCTSVDFLVPDRARFGYGLTPEIVAVAAAREPRLIVTVDNGVSSHDGVAAARALGISVLVTDHHLPGPSLPAANVIVNPNLPGSTFGSRALAGVGVAFYVALALGRRLGVPTARTAGLLDLVALGTVADVVPLDRNNRILVSAGLARIRAGRGAPGIRALAEVAGRALPGLGASDLGFFIGPRLNAAGRIDDMSIGIECLLSDDEVEASTLASKLDGINRERRSRESAMQQGALELLEAMRFAEPGARMPAALCLYRDDWSPGIVGLVASRIKDRVHRPVIAFAPADGGEARGSARSVSGIHVRDALEAIATRHPGLIAKFGGHAMAAGLTLQATRVREFAGLFAAEIERRATPGLLDGAILTDGPLEASELVLDTAVAIKAAGPFGSGFAEPAFDGVFSVIETRVLGQSHLKLWVRSSAQSVPIEAIAFRWLDTPGRSVPSIGTKLHLVYRLEVNDYAGQTRLQLLIDHLEPLGTHRH